jgi:hypothetical protein
VEIAGRKKRKENDVAYDQPDAAAHEVEIAAMILERPANAFE